MYVAIKVKDIFPVSACIGRHVVGVCSRSPKHYPESFSHNKALDQTDPVFLLGYGPTKALDQSDPMFLLGYGPIKIIVVGPYPNKTWDLIG